MTKVTCEDCLFCSSGITKKAPLKRKGNVKLCYRREVRCKKGVIKTVVVKDADSIVKKKRDCKEFRDKRDWYLQIKENLSK